MSDFTPEQQAELDAVAEEAARASADLQRMAAANAARVRAQDAESELSRVADVVGGFQALAEQAIAKEMLETGRTREQVIAAAEQQALEDEKPKTAARTFAAERRRMVAAGVPELYIQHVGDREPIDCEALQLVRAHAMRRSGFLVLGGGKGVQKTGSACWMLGQVEDGVFVDAVDLVDIAFHDRPMMLRLRRAKHVVLDDLGAEQTGSTGADAAQFSKALDTLWRGWYANDATVIVTGNFTKEQFVAYGDRIKDRMAERGRFFTVGGASVRSAMRQHWADTNNDRGEP